MSQDTALSTAPSPGAEAAPARVDDPRQALQGRIDALRDAGALPAPPAGDAAASVAQWSNWSNG